MHGEKKDNLLGEKIVPETFDEIKANQKTLIDSTSCFKPERKVNNQQILLKVIAWHC